MGETPRGGLLKPTPALDGLRGLAVTLVVLFHLVGHHVLRGGWVGVDVFFGLSGFLITALLLDEHWLRGRLNVAHFLARRAYRLLPALLLLLAVWSVMLVFFHDDNWFAATPSGDGTGRHVQPLAAMKDVGLSLAYLANWDVIAGGMEAPLPHLWSLAVEEQFYLVWPWLMLLALRLSFRARVAFLVVLIGCSALLPLMYWDGGAGQERIYFGSDTRAVGLLAGGLVAVLWHRRGTLGRSGARACLRAWFGLAAIVIVAWHPPDARTKSLAAASGIALAVALVIPELLAGRSALAKVMSGRALRWAGRRSYALYLWNYPFATWTHPLGLWPGVPLGLVGTLLSAELSWWLVESTALRRGSRFAVPRSRPDHPADPRVPRQATAASETAQVGLMPSA